MSNIAVERPIFFEGQYLGAEDLAALVTYLRTQDARQILGHHTWGIAAGLDLYEMKTADNTLEVYLQPGVAFDGYGRVIAVLNRTKLNADLLKAGAYNGEVDVWIGYAQKESKGVRKGFEVCSDQDSYSRMNESFAIEFGPRNSIQDRQSAVAVNGVNVADAREALHQVNPAAPLVCDGSMAHQDLPLNQANLRWLVPLGMVHWQAAAGSFKELTNDQRVRSRSKRRHTGVVAENIYAGDGVIRLRDRFTAYDAAKKTDDLCRSGQLSSEDMYLCKGETDIKLRELIWLEGNLRIEGDARLFGTRLEFRDDQGRDYIDRTVDGTSKPKSTPLLLQRSDASAGSDLQLLIGQSDAKTTNRFTVCQAAATGNDLCDLDITATEQVVFQDDGKVGIGAVDSTLNVPLTIRGIGSEDDLLGFEDDNKQCRWQINLGPGKDSLNIVETQPDKSRLFIESGGRVGLGTTAPVDSLHIKGDDADIFLDINSTSPNSPALHFGCDGVYDSRISWSGTTKKTTIHSQGSDALVIDKAKVGIGTAAPDAPLAVQGNAGGLRLYSGQTNGHFRIGLYTDGGPGSARSGWIGYDSDGTAAFSIRNEKASGDILLQPSRHVGIGTSTPTHRLTVQSATEDTLRLIGPKRNGHGAKLNFGDSDYVSIQEDPDDTLKIYARRGTSIRGDSPNTVLSVHGRLWVQNYGSIGSDYAEYFESADGVDIPCGTSVVIEIGMVRPAQPSETPIGIISANPGLAGGVHVEWPKKYLRDAFGAFLFEEHEAPAKAGDAPGDHGSIEPRPSKTTKRPKLNPQYDPSQPYIPREDRLEWHCVGLLGKLPLRKGQPVSKNWVKLEDITDDVELWLVK